MTGLEIILIILIAIWSVIFLVIGIMLVMVFFQVKRAISKANSILDKTALIADKADLPSKVVTASIIAFMAKNSFGPLKKILTTILSKRS